MLINFNKDALFGREKFTTDEILLPLALQDLDDSVISDVVSQLHDLADGNLGNKQLLIFHGCLDDVIAEGRRRKLSDDVIIEIYHLFCKVITTSVILQARSQIQN